MTNDPIQLHALADGELQAADREQAIRLLDVDPAARAEYEAVLSLKRVLAERRRAFDDEELWRSCRKRLDEIDGARRTEAFVGRYAWALSCLVLVVIVGAALFNRATTPDRMFAGDVPRMLAGLAPMPLSRGGDRVRDEVADVGRAPILLSRHDLRLHSAATGEFEGRRVARLVYRDAAGPVELMICPGAGRVDGATPSDEGRYHAARFDQGNCLIWTERGTTYIMVAPRGLDELARIADEYRAVR
jgi:anti-sigma factor RsiW